MIFLLRRLFKYFSFIFKLFENRGIKKFDSVPPKHSPVFILGVPRSGTTIFYQILTSWFDVSYVNNFVNLVRPNIFFGFQLSNWVFKSKPHNSFQSNFGKTNLEDLNAPSEAGQIWYKWLPDGEIILDSTNVKPHAQVEFKKTINALINRFDKPIIIKNLYFTLRIKLLNSLFPNAKYIVVKREPFYIAQSILLARKKKNIAENENWSATPPQIDSIEINNVYERIAAQIFLMDELIQKDLADVRPENVRIIEYEKLDKIEPILEDLKSFMGVAVRKYPISIFQELKLNNTMKISAEEEKKLRLALAKYS